MSEQIDDGGTAFPAEGIASLGSRYCTPGMSLRQWFAGQVLSSLSRKERDSLATMGSIAYYCYAVSDAMIREGAKHDDK